MWLVSSFYLEKLKSARQRVGCQWPLIKDKIFADKWIWGSNLPLGLGVDSICDIIKITLRPSPVITNLKEKVVPTTQKKIIVLINSQNLIVPFHFKQIFQIKQSFNLIIRYSFGHIIHHFSYPFLLSNMYVDICMIIFTLTRFYNIYNFLLHTLSNTVWFNVGITFITM